MSNNAEIERLFELSKTLSQKVNNDLKLVDALNQNVIKNLTDEQKGEMDKYLAITNKALNLSKEGKQDEAINIIKEMQNERKRK